MEKNKEQLIQDSLRGFFSNSFFHIYVNGEFNSDISTISSLQDRGTVMHEYTHYIQNIGTLWGLYCSIAKYQEIIELKKKIKSLCRINRPLPFPSTDSIIRKRNSISFGEGTTKYPRWKIDETKPINIGREHVDVNGREEEQILLTFDTEGNGKQTVKLGAFIIKESMAALYQSLIDQNAVHDDVPYNLVAILASQYYPQTASDVRKLICCCHTSLFNMNPGVQLLNNLAFAEEHPEINGFKQFELFINGKVTTKSGNKQTIVEFFNHMVDGFKSALDSNLVSDLDYINAALERVKLDNTFYPFLSVLYEDVPFDEKVLSDMMSYYGIPYIQAKNGMSFPSSTKENAHQEDASIDVLELIAQEALILNMCVPKRLYVCPLYYMCQGSEYEKPECFDTPWKGGLCSYKIVSDSLGMDTKEIL